MNALKHRLVTKPGYKILAVLLLIIITGYSVDYLTFKPAPLPTTKQPICSDCHSRKKAMIEYFKKSKNPTPEALATAVLATKNPRLLAALAVKGERNTPYTVRRGGLNGAHAGSFQVNRKFWGKVPHDPVGQALQSERILEALVSEEPNIIKALNSYGGESDKVKGKYAYNVIAELVNVP